MITFSQLEEPDDLWDFTTLLQQCAQAHQADTDRLEAGADKLVLADAAAATAAAEQTLGAVGASMATGIQGTIRQRGPLKPATGEGMAAHK